MSAQARSERPETELPVEEARLRRRLYDLLDSARRVLRRYPATGEAVTLDSRQAAAASEQLELLSELLTEASFANDALRNIPDLTRDGALVSGATHAALAVLGDTLAILSALDYLRSAA